MELSIIILNYNGKHWLEGCLQSLFENIRSIDFEVIIVDNASTDGSIEYVEKEFSSVRIIKNKTNVGFTRGNNIGIKEAVGEYICILNNDTIILSDAIENLLGFVKSYPSKVLAAGRLLGFDGRFQTNYTRFPKFVQEYLNFTIFKLKAPKFLVKKRAYVDKKNGKYVDKVRKVDVVTGTFFIIKREDMLKLGGFDENIFIFYEDADLCFRFRKDGGHIFYYPDAVIKHYMGGYYKSHKLDAIKKSYQSILYYFRKHYGRGYCFLFDFAVKKTIFIMLFYLMALPALISNENSNYRRKIEEKIRMFHYIVGI
ncbi:MAG: glycosyltransferase family 2 protein [bacterium]|nr:glycosyltransferase family 2 protein [bacterium]